MNWPDALVRELAARRCIVFLGSGASAGCLSFDGTKNPPTWADFLKHLIDLIPNLGDKIDVINDLIDKQKYLEAAEIIYEYVNKADYTSFIRRELDIPRYQPSKIHEAVLQIDPKLVVTTNYDKIYEDYCRTGSAVDGYNVAKYYDDHLAADIKSPVRSIIKAHGCVSDSSKIILTKSQYFKARRDYGNFFKILDSLFITNTILFIGYSLNDPDIQLVLENANITAPSVHPHYFIIDEGTPPAIKRANTLSYNIEFIEFPSGNYDELNNGLQELAEEVVQLRIINPSI